MAAVRRLLGRPWGRYLVVTVLAFPFALGVRAALQAALEPTLREKAEGYVEAQGVRPLSAPLAGLLAEARADAPSQPHPLLGKAAPDFSLPDDTGRPVRLTDLRKGGPAVVVFYYGYYCPHCVAQLVALDKDAGKFDELGAAVVAVSADPPADTAARFREFGRFAFPVVSDADNTLAEAYGAFTPEAEGRAEDLLHGTFVVAPDGVVRWAYMGRQPFLDNATLLREAAKAAGRKVGEVSR